MMRLHNFIVPLLALAAALFGELPLFSADITPEVERGDVSILYDETTLEIHASDDSIIHFSTLNLDKEVKIKT